MAPSHPPVVRAVADIRAAVARYRQAGETVALAPTMGALHEGHLSLVRLGRERAKRVIVSIFVNPRQFAANEDLARYPRDQANDLAKLASAPCDLVWAPTDDDMYPKGFATRVEPAGAAEGLEGAIRPHHFGGVATVCLKLFGATAPDIAVFGEKDYQQLCVIRQMVRDFNLALEIVAAPTVRESDGLALSSRNAYLSPAERRIAPALHRRLREAAERVKNAASVDAACAAASRKLIEDGFAAVDYVAARDAETLGPLTPGSGRRARVLGAARLGSTRLIDNVGA